MVAVLVARRCTASSAAGTAQVAAVAVVGTTAVATVEVVVAHRRSGTHRSRRPSGRRPLRRAMCSERRQALCYHRWLRRQQTQYFPQRTTAATAAANAGAA